MSNLHLDSLMQNNYLRDESTNLDSQSDVMKGGAVDIVIHNRPTGGFPPIFKCERGQIIKEEDNKNRAFANKHTSISIKEIMEKRRDEKPFTI